MISKNRLAAAAAFSAAASAAGGAAGGGAGGSRSTPVATRIPRSERPFGYRHPLAWILQAIKFEKPPVLKLTPKGLGFRIRVQGWGSGFRVRLQAGQRFEVQGNPRA